MEAVAPPALNGLANLLSRRPPVLTDLIAQIRHTEDYVWFAELTRRLFPDEADAILAAPGIRERMESFLSLFEERHFPLHPIFMEFGIEEDDEPPYTWLRRAVPFRLMGFSYDDLHEMWDIYDRGISALALLGEAPYNYPTEPDGIRVAWLEAAADHIPQQTLLRIPDGGISADTLASALRGTRFEAAAWAVRWTRAETGNFFMDYSYDDGIEASDPWEDEIIERGTDEWRRATRIIDAVFELTHWLEDDLPDRFAEMLDFILDRIQSHRQEENDSE